MRATRGRPGQVIAWLVLLGVAVALAAAVFVPRLAGATPYAVLTGSMRPDYPPGTLVVVRPVAAEEVRTGDVITYQLESGKPVVVTHRVVEVRRTVEGEITFLTRGDANDAADGKPVRPVQVKGRAWYAVPHLGRAHNLLSSVERQLAVYVVGGGLVAYAAAMFTGAARDRRRLAASSPREEERAW
jgi:signal peptidase I